MCSLFSIDQVRCKQMFFFARVKCRQAKKMGQRINGGWWWWWWSCLFADSHMQFESNNKCPTTRRFIIGLKEKRKLFECYNWVIYLGYRRQNRFHSRARNKLRFLVFRAQHQMLTFPNMNRKKNKHAMLFSILHINYKQKKVARYIFGKW